MNSYVPRTLDTAAIELPASLHNLIERLAENTHDVWATARLVEGWTLGLTRDDAHKKHPCLVPYDQLPEDEKEYDRATVRETLKAILKLGYRIDEPTGRPGAG